jgi:hypothetical protein
LDFHFPRRDPGADLCSDSFGEKGLGVCGGSVPPIQ